MRQHKFKLVGENLDKLFKQWQMSRQYMFAKGLDGKMKLLPPLPFEPNAQKYEDGWHIPYATTEQLYLANMYSKPESWVCLKRSKSRGKQWRCYMKMLVLNDDFDGSSTNEVRREISGVPQESRRSRWSPPKIDGVPRIGVMESRPHKRKHGWSPGSLVSLGLPRSVLSLLTPPL